MDSLDTKNLFGAKNEKELGVGIADEKSSFDMGEISFANQKSAPVDDRFSRSSDDYAPRNDYGVKSAESLYGAGTATPEPQNTYGTAQNTYGNTQNTYGAAQNTYGTAPNTYGNTQNTYVGTQNTYVGTQNTYVTPTPATDGLYKEDEKDYVTDIAAIAGRASLGRAAATSSLLSNTSYIPPQQNKDGGYTASFSQVGVYYSGEGTGTMADYAEENNILTKINKIKKHVDQAAGWLTAVGTIELVCAVVIAIASMMAPELSAEMGFGAGMVVFQAITSMIFTALAFGVEKKSFGASLAATIIQGFVVLIVLIGGNRAAVIYRVAVFVALIMATKSINDYNKMKPQYQFHPNPRISELFIDNPAKQGKKVYKTVVLVIAAVMAVIGIIIAVSSIGGVIGDFVGEKPVAEWSYTDVGEFDFKMPTEVSSDIDSDYAFYSSITLNAGVEIEVYEGYLEGMNDMQVKAYLPSIIDMSGYDEYFAEYTSSYGYDLVAGSKTDGTMATDECYYHQRAYLDDEDGEYVILRAIAADDDVIVVMYYCYPDGDDYNAMAEEYFATATRNY